MTTNVTFNTTSTATGARSDNQSSGKFSMKDLKELLALLKKFNSEGKADTTDAADDSDDSDDADNAIQKILKKMLESMQTGNAPKSHSHKGRHHEEGMTPYTV